MKAILLSLSCLASVWMVGNDSDVHGCKASAGYQWSVLMNSCVRIFEQGIRLDPQDSHLPATLSAFIIFNADQSQVELFLPQEKTSKILIREGKEGAHHWVSGSLNLYPWKGYVLKNGDTVLYHGDRQLRK